MAKLTDKDPLAEIRENFWPSLDRMKSDLERVSAMDGADPAEVEKLRAGIAKLQRDYGRK